jgi:proline iminopeptidase
VVREGLAVDIVGEGPPVLVFPYPHGSTTAPMAHDALAARLVEIGRRVVTFDPPGAWRSERRPRCDLPEMLSCAEEALACAGITDAVDVAGHSMGAFCALAWALERTERTARLVLVGVPTGGWWPILRDRGLPFSFPIWDRRFWQYAGWGIVLGQGRGSLALHKRHMRLGDEADIHHPELVPPLVLDDGDELRPAPVRNRWIREVAGLDLGPRLGQVRAPTLVCAGRHDRSTPLRANRRAASQLRARLVVFEDSGHAPFLEEPARFRDEVARWLGEVPPTEGRRS